MVSADTWRRLRQDFISFHFLFFWLTLYSLFSCRFISPCPILPSIFFFKADRHRRTVLLWQQDWVHLYRQRIIFFFLFSQISLHPMTSARHARRASATQKCTAFKSTAYRMHVCFSPFVLVQTPMSGYACESVTDACKVHVHGVSGGHIRLRSELYGPGLGTMFVLYVWYY